MEEGRRYRVSFEEARREEGKGRRTNESGAGGGRVLVEGVDSAGAVIVVVEVELRWLERRE